MAKLGHRHGRRIDALGDHHQALGGTTDDAVVSTERTRRDDLGVYERSHDKPRRFSRLTDHPGELRQPSDAIGIDRATEILVVDRSTGRQCMHASHGLNGRALPYGYETQKLGRQTYGSPSRGVTASGRKFVGLICAAL